MPPRRFQRPDQHPPRDMYGPWAAVVAVVLLFWLVFVVLAAGALGLRNVKADHDGEDQPWRRPILAACEPRWDPADPRIVTYDGRTLHMERAHADPALDPRIMFYLTWGSDDLDGGTHLRRWRWEYECTHPRSDETMPALVTVGARLPRGGGGPVFVHSGPSPPPGYPDPHKPQKPLPEEPEPPGDGCMGDECEEDKCKGDDCDDDGGPGGPDGPNDPEPVICPPHSPSSHYGSGNYHDGTPHGHAMNSAHKGDHDGLLYHSHECDDVKGSAIPARPPDGQHGSQKHGPHCHGKASERRYPCHSHYVHESYGAGATDGPHFYRPSANTVTPDGSVGCTSGFSSRQHGPISRCS